MNLSKINIVDIQGFINNLPQTRIKEFAVMTVKQILKRAYEHDLIQKDIGQFIEKGKIYKGKVSWFYIGKQKNLLKNLPKFVPEIYRLSIYTLLLTGCRPNGLCTIQKSNIKKNMLLINGTKTIHARRWVKISIGYKNNCLM